MNGFLDIRPGERRNTYAAFATLLALTTGHTLLETARDTFFLAKMPASRLPWMYLVIVDGVAVALLVGALVTTGFRTTMSGGTATHRSLYALYVWTGLFGSWAMRRGPARRRNARSPTKTRSARSSRSTPAR